MTALTERSPLAIVRPRCTRRGPTQLAEHLADGRAGDLVGLGQLLRTARRAKHLTGTAVPAS